MNIKKLQDKVFLVEDILSPNLLGYCKEYTAGADLDKRVGKGYSLHSGVVPPKILSLLKLYFSKTGLLDEINLLFGDSTVFTPHMSINLMRKGDYLDMHNDTINLYQGILYLDSLDAGDGGELCISDILYTPQKNTAIIFDSSLAHGVKKIKGDVERKIISFGFISDSELDGYKIPIM